MESLLSSPPDELFIEESPLHLHAIYITSTDLVSMGVMFMELHVRQRQLGRGCPACKSMLGEVKGNEP